VGAWHLRRGEFSLAETHFRRAIERLTLRNANPYDGEPLYHLGQTLRHLGRNMEAYAAFYKATWNQAWQSAGYHALAELDCQRGDWATALDHLDRSLRLNTDHLNARNLRVMVLRQLGRTVEAESALSATLTLDPLDGWARWLAGQPMPGDTQSKFDLALDLARAGLDCEAIALLETAVPEPSSGTAPLIRYYLGWLYGRLGDETAAFERYQAAAKASPDYCFPARLEEIAILEDAMRRNPHDARAPYYLGNLFYDLRRHHEAIELWKQATRLDQNFSIAWRNLGLGLFNIAKQPAKARAAYDHACCANPRDARLLFERDQLWKRLGVTPAVRVKVLEKYSMLVAQRDDLSVEFCALCNQVGCHGDALAILSSRKFQPWEGGEGQALGQHVQTHLALGRKALAAGDAVGAAGHFKQALTSPPNLAEAKHFLANQSDIHYWLGMALHCQGDPEGAARHWSHSAEFRGDFQEMSVRAFSEMTYFSALSLQRLGQAEAAQKLLRELLAYGKRLAKTPAKIDYFATSLPTMLLFDDDIQFRQGTAALFLQAQALLGLGRKKQARETIDAVLKRDPNHPLANHFLVQA
jgi:tetratricopeptide (TPR) repeat protein